MSENSNLQNNTDSLQAILETVNNLPDAGIDASAIESHNTSETAHSDIRQLIANVKEDAKTLCVSIISENDDNTYNTDYDSSFIIECIQAGRNIILLFQKEIFYILYADGDTNTVIFYVHSTPPDSNIPRTIFIIVNGTVATMQIIDAVAPIDKITATVGQIAKVKTVDENGNPTEWEAADISSECYYVEIVTVSTTDGSTFTASHNYTEIKTAVEAGKAVFLNVCNETLFQFTMFNGTSSAVFSRIDFDGTAVKGNYAHVREDNTVTFWEDETLSIPTLTESDYGKVLSATADGVKWTFNNEVPYFDLVEMGLPEIPLNGTYVHIASVDTTVLRNALSNGNVKVKVAINIDGVTAYVTTILGAAYLELNDCYQMMGIAALDGNTYNLKINVLVDKINAWVYELQRAITYTESDYGKVLTCTSSGLAWTNVVLPSADGGAF